MTLISLLFCNFIVGGASEEEKEDADVVSGEEFSETDALETYR